MMIDRRGRRLFALSRMTAAVLGVSQYTISKDLESLLVTNKPHRPKGGRPKGRPPIGVFRKLLERDDALAGFTTEADRADRDETLPRARAALFCGLMYLRRHHWGRNFYLANETCTLMPGGGWSRKRFAAPGPI